jgi:hypothetical protein
MDREAWYSVTPEPIAKYLAERANINKVHHNNGDSEQMSVDE